MRLLFLLLFSFSLSFSFTSAQDLVYELPSSPQIDGMATETFWADLQWKSLSHLFVDNQSGNQNTLPTSTDFNGRYKVGWKDNQLFFLVEVTDDVLYYQPYNGSPTQIIDHDNVEIFLDENNSGGAHTKTHNAFAFHVSANGNTADQCGCGDAGDFGGNSGDWNGRLFNNVVQSEWSKNNNTYTWELAVTVYTDSYTDGAPNNTGALANLYPGKILGYGVAYNDYDTRMIDGKIDRDHMMGGFFIPGNNNGNYGVPGGRNVGWQDASVFGEMELALITETKDRVGATATLFYIPKTKELVIPNSMDVESLLIISSMDGRILETIITTQEQVSVNHLPQGMYMVQQGGEVIKILVD